MGVNPLEMIGVGAPLAGGYLQAQGLRRQGEAQASAAEYNADLALLEGRTEAARRRRTGSAEVTRERVALANSGLRLEGSPLQFLARQAAEVERDAVNVELAARRTARLDRAQAASARSAARIGAGTSLLTGATQAASHAYSMRLFGAGAR